MYGQDLAFVVVAGLYFIGVVVLIFLAAGVVKLIDKLGWCK